jgi:hypothetical protein
MLPAPLRWVLRQPRRRCCRSLEMGLAPATPPRLERDEVDGEGNGAGGCREEKDERCG